MIKKLISATSIFILLCTVGQKSFAQTQKDHFLIGGSLSNINLDFQEGNTAFSLDITPRVAWFVKDNFALGAEVLLGVDASKGYTAFNYGIGPIARYYIPVKDAALPNRTRIFFDGNVGIYGQNVKTSGLPSTNTNGLGVGIGPGLAYFINPNIALEALAKYNLNVGFGNSTTNNSLRLALGFQIYLPKGKLKSLKDELDKK
ncbi:MAG: outer membrane beta-barrel protein [Chitinophagaceae bacterium]